MKTDFEEFMNEDSRLSPPRALSERISARVGRDLNPDPWLTFARLAAIHLFSALLTLSFCPQFGIRLFGHGMGLMHYFMRFGDLGCGLACGTLFFGSSLLIASLVLSPDQIRVIRRHRVLEIGALALLSLGFFIMLQAEIVAAFALAWLVGSLAGGIVSLELGWSLRLQARAKA